MSVKLGVTLPQFTDDPGRFRDAVALAEDLGIDSVWAFDHLWPLSGGRQRPILECWSSLAYIAASTSKVGIGTLVTRSSLRHPAVLAKMAATVGCIAPGRLTITVGSGDKASRPENEAFGLPYWAGTERVDQLRSTVEVLRSFLEGGTVSQSDGFVDIEALPASPVPSPRPALWVGGRAGDTLEVAATLADGWNGWGGTPDRFAQDRQEVLRFAGEREVEFSWGGLVVLEANDDAASAVSRKGEPALIGGPETISAKLATFAEAGATHLIVTFAGVWSEERLRLLAGEVAPALKDPAGS
jgi:alkanesulfonate monooxygenase SsuD/methylene tetrahydromethanopterin reductase-like flavin-dependent oxidoreductase (luciferase family)